MRRFEQSRALWERARTVLAGGVSTNVRAAERPWPLFFESGRGARLRDADGNELLDYVGGFGAVLLGHGHPAIAERVREALLRGHQFGGQTQPEIELAERLVKLVPCFEVVRFSSTGSEAMHAAMRLARAHTGRRRVIRFEGHYHGWFDEQLVSERPPLAAAGPAEAPHPVLPSAGQLPTSADDLVVLPWNELAAVDAALDRVGHEVAAIVTEPIMCNNGGIMPLPGFLEGVRERCTGRGILLIFDEVITGFRLSLGGAQAYLGVTPDLAIFSKAMANGMPISCVGGRRDIMEQVADRRVMHAGTFNGNVASVAAALATLDELERDSDALYAQLFARGQRLMDGLRSAAADAGQPLLVQGPGPVFFSLATPRTTARTYRDTLDADAAVYARFCAAMLNAGVRLMSVGRWYISFSHTDEDVDQTIGVARSAWRHARAGAA